jgi:hypothetical protein
MAISCQLVAAVLDTAKVYALSSIDLDILCLVRRYRLLISVLSPIQPLTRLSRLQALQSVFKAASSQNLGDWNLHQVESVDRQLQGGSCSPQP